MAAPFGIHLGNNSACIAIHSNGIAGVIANDSGDRVTPAVLALNGTEWEIGLPAKAGQNRNKSTVTNNKRLLNDDFTDHDITTVETTSTCKIINEDDSELKYEFCSNEGEHVVYVTPDDICTKIYSKLFTIATNAARTDGDLNVVLAAPLSWSKNSRQRLITAAELAGFNVLQVVSEPAAAVLAYGIGEMDPDVEDYVLVYRLGGTSCDATVVKVSSGLYSIENSIHRSDLGGKCLTNDLTYYIAQEFAHKWKLDPRESRRSMSKLFNHADNCKHILSTLSSAHVFIESLCDGVDWSQNVSRARFENIISSKTSAYMEPIISVLSKNDLENKVKKVIICGGSLKIPKLQTAIASVLPQAEILSRISPDEVIAEGCARQAALLSDLPDLNLSDIHMELNVISKPITMEYSDKSVTVFQQGSPSHAEIEVRLQDDVEKLDFFGGEDFIDSSVKSYTNGTTLKVALDGDDILVQAIS